MGKNLANCNPVEFLKQTNRLRKSAAKWVKNVGILDIRKRIPDLSGITDKAEREKLVREQALSNLSDILDKVLEEFPEETVEILALSCFVEPENANDYTMSYYLSSVAELLNDDGVLSFFTSLVRLDQRNTLTASKQSE